jgi:threonine aldolase
MPELIADFRSDTVTRPCQKMRQAMASAAVGDDVFGDDPSVNHLEAYLAERSGKDAALFCSSGTQSNLVALLAHCQRGDEYIVGQEAHTYKYEAGGAAVLGSIQPQPLDYETDSTLDLKKVKAKLKADDYHFARSRLLCIENTRSGDVLPLKYHGDAARFCKREGLALHLDGARLFNAMVKQGVELADYTKHYDSVSLCISKGLGAPIGSLLVGDKAFIDEARRWRKMVGGGMRQAGILAAACEFALENNVTRLGDDNDNALALAEGLANISGINCDVSSVQTNMVFITVEDESTAQQFQNYMAQHGVVIIGGQLMRLVTHLDINAAAIGKTIALSRDFFE